MQTECIIAKLVCYNSLPDRYSILFYALLSIVSPFCSPQLPILSALHIEMFWSIQKGLSTEHLWPWQTDTQKEWPFAQMTVCKKGYIGIGQSPLCEKTDSVTIL